MKKFFSVIPSLVVLLLIVAVGIYFSVGQKLVVKEVKVTLAPSSSEKILFENIQNDLNENLKNLHGQSMLKLSFQNLSDDILKDKRIKSVHLRREFPFALIVQVEPHEPVLGWVDKRGFVRLVSRDNQVLPRLKSSPYRDVALLRGREFDDEETRQKALELMDQLPLEGFFRRSLISEIRFQKASGFDLVLSEPSLLVRIGSDDYKSKSARLEKVLNYLHSRDIKGRVIDSRFNKKVVVRLRNEP